MKVSAAIAEIKNRIDDPNNIEYSITELTGWINDALDWLSVTFASIKYPEFTKETTITDGGTLPEDYIEQCGINPIIISGQTVKLLNGATTYTLRYFYRLPFITYDPLTSSFTPADLPVKEMLTPVILQKASIYAWNRNNYDVAQDEALLNQLLQGLGVTVRYAQIGEQTQSK